jgi:hypothetical protein
MYQRNFVGQGYVASGLGLQTSIAGEELLVQSTDNYSREYRKIGLYNLDALNITWLDLNNQFHSVYCPATVGFAISPEDLPVTSLKIYETGKQYALITEW